jgi:acyl-CoA thioester hydrolase
MKSEIKYRVPYADTDQMGVVYYANYLEYFERLRNELLREAGTPYSQIEKMGIILPVIEAYCKYIAPAKYDDLISISGWIEEAKGARLKIKCEIRSEKNSLLVEGWTVHACVNAVSKKPIRIPVFLLP